MGTERAYRFLALTWAIQPPSVKEESKTIERGAKTVCRHPTPEVGKSCLQMYNVAFFLISFYNNAIDISEKVLSFLLVKDNICRGGHGVVVYSPPRGP